MYLKALCAMHHLKWKGVNPNNWVRVGAILCAMPPTPVAPFTGTYISFWYWHHFLMPKATRELQKRSRTATAVGQGKWLALVFLPSPVRDTQSSSECPQRGEKSRLAACDSLLPALSSGVSAAPHHRAEGPKLSTAVQIYRLSPLCSDWVYELISATCWFTWWRLFRHSPENISSKTHWFSLFPCEKLHVTVQTGTSAHPSPPSQWFIFHTTDTRPC